MTKIKAGVSGIYKIILNNGKIYIGLSNDIQRRMREHRVKDCKEYPELPISKAIMKYGIKDVEIIEEIDAKDRKLLQEREQYWIKYYNSFVKTGNGYNLSPGGDGGDAGVNNSASKLTTKDLATIIDLLKNSTLTYKEINNIIPAATRIVVSGINNGKHYYNSKIKYPIRKKRLDKTGESNKTSKFFNNNELLLQIINEIKTSPLELKELSKKYNVSMSVLGHINSGSQYKQENETYPLRPKRQHCSHIKLLSNSELEQIKTLLENNVVSMESIAKQFGCDVKKISKINKGIIQPNNSWDYPIRKK